MLLNTCSPLPSLIDQIKTLGELRVATRSSPLSYYIGEDGVPQGPEYDFARRFADELGVTLKITPMRSYADIYAALSSGRVHLAAAGLKVPQREIPGIEFGPTYQRVREHLIYRRGAARPASLAEIGNGEARDRGGSAYAKALNMARDNLPELAWVEDATTNSQGLLEGVARGTIDYTIADSTEFAFAHDTFPDLRIAFDFPGSQSLAWAASDRYPEFRQAMGAYFANLNTTGELASVLDRYYGHSEDAEFAEAPDFMRHLQSRLPLYKQWVEEAASRAARIGGCLRPSAIRSRNGTERSLRIRRARPNAAHHPIGKRREGGEPHGSSAEHFRRARYFRRLYEKISPHVPEPDRTWFALAAYNIGYGHLEDARVLAQKAGRDPDSWDDVRQFLPLLAQEEWYTQTENG